MESSSRPKVSITVDPMADAAYVTLSDHSVASTCQLNQLLLADLDEHGMAVGVEVLRVDAEIPFDELTDKYHVGPMW